MKRGIRVVSVWMSLAFTAAGLGAETRTLQGEVVDLSCYLGRGASGPEHAECAERCIAASRTAGFRADDGTLYLLLQASAAPPPAELVAGLAGRPVAVEGSVTERDGFKALRLTSVRLRE